MEADKYNGRCEGKRRKRERDDGKSGRVVLRGEKRNEKEKEKERKVKLT